MTKQALTAVGITCGIGSMMLGARLAGFSVMGNVEWRRYYHRQDAEGHNTFLNNFPGAFMVHQYDELSTHQRRRIKGVDLAMGHPECGNFSNLNANKGPLSDPGDIPLFVEMVREIRPRYFAMDDLPKSFLAYPMEKYAEMLPEYDLFPEWVSNWGYGNVQKARNRFFMLGALKKERFAFVPGEAKHTLTVADIIGDLYRAKGIPNHDVHTLVDACAKGLHLRHRDHRATWKEMRDYILKEVKEGGPITYINANGDVKTRIGSYKGHWNGPAHVLTGGISGFHPKTGLPYSIRERARIQGFPDDFIFYGTEFDKKGHWNHDKNIHMVRQTGKAMPIQFNRYFAEQVRHAIQKQPFEATGQRVLTPNQYISDAKSWYCDNVGYRNQKDVCANCWQRQTCELKRRK